MVAVPNYKELNIFENENKQNKSVLGEKKGTFNKVNLLKKINVLKAKENEKLNQPLINRFKKKLIYISKKEKKEKDVEEQALNFID